MISSGSSTLARSYARALLGLVGSDQRQMQILQKNLKVLAKVYADSKVKATLNLQEPKVGQALLIELAASASPRKACPDTRHALSEKIVKLLALLGRNFRLLPEIYAMLQAYQAKSANTMEIVLRANQKLLKSQKNKLRETLVNRLGFNVEIIKEQVDQKLLGGVVLASEDLILDGSILGSLKRLRRHLLKAQL